MLLAQPWLALELSPLAGIAGAVIGGAVLMVIAEGAFRSLRTSVAQDLRRDAQAAIREEERKRLGFDLHDDVCQELVGVGILIESVGAQLDEATPGRATLGRASVYVNEVVEHLRELARELRPLPLRDLGLEGGLRSLANGLSSAETRVEVHLPKPIPRLAEEIEVGVYRVAHEAITNAVRHAAARTIAVRLQTQNQRLRLEIEDDGQGFDVDEGHGTAIGLASMEERAAALGGQLTVRSRRGNGTRVILTCTAGLRAPASAA